MADTKIKIEVIRAAKQGDSEAMQAIVEHYDPLIRSMASKTCTDSEGRLYTVIDESLRDRMVEKLMMQIFYKYEIGGKKEKTNKAADKE